MHKKYLFGVVFVLMILLSINVLGVLPPPPAFNPMGQNNNSNSLNQASRASCNDTIRNQNESDRDFQRCT